MQMKKTMEEAIQELADQVRNAIVLLEYEK